MTYKRTDLALEETEKFLENAMQKNIANAVKIIEQTKGDIKITRVEILNEEGAKQLTKPIGTYVTLESETLNYMDNSQREDLCLAIKEQLEKIVKIDLSKPVLVVGLGNRNITADALGPKAVEQMLVTRHLFENMREVVGEDTASVCALAPGVLGITGIETMEIVKGVCQRVKPGLVIAIDALAARKIERINTTIQISNTGINPGSGVGNNRKALNRDTLGVDVIALGVPTVVDAVTFANDALDITIDAIKKSSKEAKGVLELLCELKDEEKYALLDDVLSSSIGEMVLTVKEVDLVMNKISKVIAGGINTFLQKGMQMEQIESLTL